MGFPLAASSAGLGLSVEVAVFVAITAVGVGIDCRFVGRQHVGWFDVRPERRVGQHYVEAFLKHTVDVHEAIVVVNPAVAIAVQDHVHLAGAGHAIVGVGAVDALI